MPVGRAAELYCPHCKGQVGWAGMFGSKPMSLQRLTDAQVCPNCGVGLNQVAYCTGKLYTVEKADLVPSAQRPGPRIIRN